MDDNKADDIPAFDVRVKGFFNHRGHDDMLKLLKQFYEATDIEESKSFEKAIWLAQNPDAFASEREDELSLTEKETVALDLDREPEKKRFAKRRRLVPHWQKTDFSKWRGLPWPLWKVIILCAIGATVQGWDEAAVNGAQVWYQAAFGIYITVPQDVRQLNSQIQPRPLLVGLVNGAPYLCCVMSCWFTPWLNDKLGRRGTIFWCAIFSIAFALAQAFAQTWQQLLAFRLLMGLGIGPKSATVPIYAAECAPASIRGSLVMLWQLWTAFGIMSGCIAGVIFQKLGDLGDLDANGQQACKFTDPSALLSWRCSQNWRLILGSPAVLPIVLAAYIYGCPESPRWLIAKAHALRVGGRIERSRLFYQKAFKSLSDMSRAPLFAARDMFSHYYLLNKEREELIARQERRPQRSWIFHQLHELFIDRRNRRAIIASLVCMFAQQFCGVNFIIYYSNYIFQGLALPPNTPRENATSVELQKGTENALLYTMGFGIINLLFGVPALFLIDTIGRRSLLLSTFLFLALSHVITAVALDVHRWQVALVGMYMFAVFYSVGEGPVPFVYASESMPLHVREKGMAFVTSINWLFNWLIAFTGAPFIETFKEAGIFWWYAGWCIVLWFAILLLVPETRALTLEELSFVFSEISMKDFATHAWNSSLWHVRILKDLPPRLYEQPEQQWQLQQPMNGTIHEDKPDKIEA